MVPPWHVPNGHLRRTVVRSQLRRQIDGPSNAFLHELRKSFEMRYANLVVELNLLSTNSA
ncbi:MAG: hypothetical protein A3F68_02975 [Acidobacteria bacterium RIFCSPLOWO2_12_FULL_54_10]|nr:MAG: hypothetical protein A3F68_02975 [Acidobacteria bacterium RIFCSPLOWO2_12_FULL_54_10]